MRYRESSNGDLPAATEEAGAVPQAWAFISLQKHRILGIYYALPAIPGVLIAATYLIALSNTMDYGTFVGIWHQALISGGAVLIFAAVYAIYIIIAFVTVHKQVEGQ